MNTNLIIAATALVVSMGVASKIANANPATVNCQVTHDCPPLALGRVKINCQVTHDCPPLALGRVKLKFQHDTVDNVRLPPFVIAHPAPAPAPTPVPVSTPPAPAPQPSGSGINVNLDLGGGYGGGNYDDSNDDGISCGEGRNIVRRHGFRKVHTVDCSGDTYTYTGKKHGQMMDIEVNMDGRIVDVSSSY